MPRSTGRSTRQPLMQLYSELSREGEEASAGIIVKWDARPLLSELDRRDFKNPYVVLAVCKPISIQLYDDEVMTDYTVTRTIVRPLDDNAWPVTFNRAGTNEVRAYVVDAKGSEERRALRKLEREGARIDYNGDLARTHGLEVIQTYAVLTVNVPDGMFAKEPPRWLKDFVGNFFESPAYDECHFRKRVLISTLVIAPLLLTFGLVFRVLVLLVALALGLRDIQWNGLEPFNMSETPWPTGDITCIYTHNAQGYRRPFFVTSLILHPLVLIIPACVTYLLVRGEHVTFWEVFAIVDGAILAVATITFVVGLLLLAVDYGWNNIVNAPARQERMRQQHEQRVAREREAYLAHLSEMSTLMAQSDSVNVAPVNLTVKLQLKFSALKAQVCKPFQN